MLHAVFYIISLHVWQPSLWPYRKGTLVQIRSDTMGRNTGVHHKHLSSISVARASSEPGPAVILGIAVSVGRVFLLRSGIVAAPAPPQPRPRVSPTQVLTDKHNGGRSHNTDSGRHRLHKARNAGDPAIRYGEKSTSDGWCLHHIYI